MNPRRSTPSTAWLLAFESAARHLSFTRAAEELALTQSVVSRHVQGLEALLGVALFKRDGRQIVLTDVGAMYVREVRGALQRIRNASMQAMNYSRSGEIHLASLPTFAARWLMPRLRTFYAAHPGVLVHIHSRIGPFDLELAGMDAAITVGDAPWSGVVSHHLLDDTLVPIASPALLRERPVAHPHDLMQHTLLQVTARADAWPRWFAEQGCDTRALQLGSQFEVTAHLILSVVAGMGIGLVPHCLVEEELRAGTLVMPFDAPLATGFSYYLVEAPHHPVSPALAALIAWLTGAEPLAEP